MKLDVISAILLSISVATGIFSLFAIMMSRMDSWRESYIQQTDMEMEEMMMQIPAEKILNYTFMIGLGLSLLAFIVVGNGPDGFNWKIGAFFATIVFILSLFMAKGFVTLLKKRRLEKFHDQLEDALMSMSNALKAGFSINQTVEMIVKQNKQPISMEFKLMVQQTQLGMSFDQALKSMAERVESEDFHLVASAISTARQTGGDLTGVFDRLAALIRERLRIKRRIMTLTAQGRLQGIVLGLLPMFLMFIIYMMEPSMVRNFFTDWRGIAAFILVIILEICGYLVIKKIVSIDI